MRTLIFILLLSLPLSFAMANEALDKKEAFYGVWGTKKQCAREPFKKGGTVRAAPYVISPQWLKQGTLWCSLNWGPVENSTAGKQSAANAHCGEDSIRSYFLSFKLKEEKLTLRWDFFRKNGPLERCVGG